MFGWIVRDDRLLLGFVLVVALASARAEPLVFQSSENRVALLELFTSEGCSSCPPAETWLSGLRSAPGLWKEFVPVSFHVDYWDYLGWRDPWASKAFSNRQREYVRHWHGDSVYTPGMVLNGQEWRSWSEQKDGPRPSPKKSGVLLVKSADHANWQITFSPPERDKHGYEVHVALLTNELISEVKSGENRGRRLRHDFVVTDLATHPLTSHGDRFETEFALMVAKPQAHQAIAFWVTQRGSLEPLQAVGGWLTN